ncbi:hypothetical protein M9H77_06733 [Catharanthus roseus]|uniref:Uncharacterized protein n=1 Tax=Catharanthus roseus TaxID=4058 RepID=A0ACC0BT60_CATRO|nr:hypothetical protein M9H77_06733 [Catharanthus roseus]
MGFEKNNEGQLVRVGQEESDEEDDDDDEEKEKMNAGEEESESETEEERFRRETRRKRRQEKMEEGLHDDTLMLKVQLTKEAYLKSQGYTLRSKRSWLSRQNEGEKIKPLKTFKTCVLLRDVLRKERSFLVKN